MMDPAGFEPATHVVRPAFAVINRLGRSDKGDEIVLELPLPTGGLEPHLPVSRALFAGLSGFPLRECNPIGIRHGLIRQTSVCFTNSTQSRVSPLAKRTIVSKTASEKPPTFKISDRSAACVVP